MEKTKSLSLFSQETLDSVVMAEIYGGDAPNNCEGGNCVQGCGQNTAAACIIEINVNFLGKCKEGCSDSNNPQT